MTTLQEQQDITHLPMVLLTYNMDKTISTSGIFRLLHTHDPDILTLQEVNLTLLDEHTIQHRAFVNKLRREGYTLQMSTMNLTIIKEQTLGPYIAQSLTSPDGRILITPLTLTHSFTLYIINTYGCQQSHPNYTTINSEILNYLGDFIDNHGNTNCHFIPIGDINIDPPKHGHRLANLHRYFLTTFKTYSTFCQLQHLNQRKDGSLPPLPVTYVDPNDGSSCLDHVCLPFSLLPDDLKENEESQPQILQKVYNSSPHHPILQRITVPFLDFEHIQDTDVPHPIFRILSSIPLMSGPDPTDPEDTKGWFQPDDTIIPPSKLASKQELITKAHQIQTTDAELQHLERETRQIITELSNSVRDHYRDSSDLMPRTTHTKQLLTDAFANIDNALYRTMTRLDLHPSLTEEKSQPSLSLSLRLELKVDTLRTTLKTIKRITKTSTTSSIPRIFKRLTRQVASLLGVITKIEEKVKTTNEDYATLVSIQNERQEAQKNKDVSSSHQTSSITKKTKKKPTHPPLISSNKDAPVQSTDDIFLRRQSSFLKFIIATKHIIQQMSNELTTFCTHDNLQNNGISRAFTTLFQETYIRKLRKRTREIITQFDNIQVDFHHLYGDSAQPARLIQLKSNPKPAANTTIPTFEHPLAPPTHVPAIGPIQQKHATCVTQQLQADKPPGTPLHFVQIQNDDVGPCGIKFHPQKPFTADDLSSYHPQATDFPQDVQEAIMDAHETFPAITKHLYDKHSSNRHAPATQWPYQARVEACPITHTETLIFTTPIPSMQQKIFYTPSAARLHGFTLNVLARLHPCWMRLLDKLTNLILVTRILPPQIKTTGRVLIDKPGTTDKRPISILHAFDSHIDTIVAKSLSSAVEKLNIYDDTIAAYRPGHSCADCTLNHLLAIQNTHARNDIYLCQLDEDKEKFFDRITTELQILPFHLMGFPPKGYLEWIAESLDGITILTNTPYGRVTTSFSCGVRQGSALSCAIANAVAWLSAAPWTIPLEGFPTPTGHTPTHLHPFDMAQDNPATLFKSSYCDDSSAYITAPNKEQLYDLISRDIHMSNVMSIVTKLSINAKKSHIRIFNLSPEDHVPYYSYISWHHSTRTVRMEPIPTDNMSTLAIDTIMRLFGTFINPKGQTQSNHKQHFPKMHAARKAFRHKTYSTLTFTAQYAALVTSTIGFNVLAMSYDLHKAVKDDHLTLYRHATKAYDLTPPADKFYNIFLPRHQLGHGFKGVLTIQLAIALARELFVSLNAPHPQYTTLLQTRMRALLHRLTFRARTYDPLDTIPHAIQQLALLGIFFRPTELPIVNNAIALLQAQDDRVTTLGHPPPRPQDHPSPLVSILNEHNKIYTSIETPYRNLILSVHQLYHTPASHFHNPQAYSEITENPHDTLPRRCTVNNPLSLQTSPSSQGIYTIQAASRELMSQYNHLSHFFELDFLRTPRLSRPESFLHNRPLSLSSSTPFSLFGDEEYPSWTDSPHRSLRKFQNLHRLSIRPRHNIPSVLPGVFRRYSSPLLFSSDSAYNHTTDYTIAASILMHFDTKSSTSPLRIPPRPILLRNHVLAKSYGTKFTDNNMGESMALTMSLNTCPCHVPTIFLLDSKLVLLQVFLYFFPKSHTIRTILRRHIHTTSTHHFSELSQALQYHWPDANFRPSRIQCDPQIPRHVIESFQDILSTLTTDLAPKTICHLQSTDAQSTSCTDEALSHDTTAGLLIGHHLFLHINSHQLTNTGKLKTTQTPDKKTVTIPPHPNLTFALANTWADRGASRLATSLTDDNAPQILLHDIPQPPITTLQYVPHHKQRTINTDSTQYIQNQFVNHNFKIAISDPAQWFLHFGLYFTDPLEKFHNNRYLRAIAQDKAYSHSRYVKINKDYRLSMQGRCHPNETFPQSKYTSTMLQCPFCPHSTIPATITHHHVACTHKVILRKRQGLLRPINAILLELDTVTNFLINYIFPYQVPNRYIPRFTKFLRAAIQNVTFITALTDTEKQDYAATTNYPPFKDLGYPNKPHWRHDGPDPTVYPPTTAHYTHLMGPSCDPPMHPLEHSTVIALLGLLPTNTHIAIADYFEMLASKFLHALNSRLPSDQRHEEGPPSLSIILTLPSGDSDHAESTPVKSIIRKARATNHKVDDIADLLSYLFRNLLQALQTKARSLQLKINSTLQEYIRKTIKNDRPPPVSVALTTVPLPKSSKPPRRKRQKSACPGTWCILRKAAGIPWTTTANSVACTQCRLIMEAINLSTRLLAQIITRPNAIALFLRYTPVATHRVLTTTLANNIAMVPIPLDELRNIICNTIPFTVINDISPHINFLNPSDAQYDQPRQELQQLVLQLLAYSSLIQTTPSLTREFPPLSPYYTHATITTATTFCVCSDPNPIPICNAHLCNDCSLLIPNAAHVPSTDPLDLHTCITCDTSINCPKFPDKPCDKCCLITIMLQNNPSSTWFRLTKSTTPSVLSYTHNTPIRFLPEPLQQPPSHCPLPSADIFIPTTDPDFLFQDFPEDETFLTHRIFPPRPPPMPFPRTFVGPATRAQNIITNMYRYSHQALFSHPGSVYLTFTRPIFPFFDGLRPPAFGYYPEAHYDDNLANFNRALPHIDIIPVTIYQRHPMKEYMSNITGRLTITWSFHSHDYRDPNQLLGPTPVTFILTFYPPIPTNPPFQYRLLFHKGNHLDELPDPTLDKTDVLTFLANRTNETPTIYVLAIIYLMATLPPEFVNDRTLFHYRLLLAENLRHLSNEMVYLHAILNDDNHAVFIQTIVSPWTITYNRPQPPYTATIEYRENPTRPHHYQRHREVLENQTDTSAIHRTME